MTESTRVHVVTGADSGLGREVARLLGGRGRVITCGVGEDVDVRADLSTARGRSDLVEHVAALSGGRVDAVVAVAGIGEPSGRTVALNYFGTLSVLTGLRALLARSKAPAAVVVSSSSSLNRGSGALVRACRSGDEGRTARVARRLIRTGRGSQIYRSTKIALNLWVRDAAVSTEWAGSGIVLNAVAPGILATETVLRTWPQEQALLTRALPQPLGSPGPVKAVADLIAHAVSPENRFMTGQVIFCDGGTDALMRGSRPLEVFLRYRPGDLWAMWREARRQSRGRGRASGPSMGRVTAARG